MERNLPIGSALQSLRATGFHPLVEAKRREVIYIRMRFLCTFHILTLQSIARLGTDHSKGKGPQFTFWAVTAE
jgi:hypothetical protein